jgi:predicted nucleic acid-binding protein
VGKLADKVIEAGRVGLDTSLFIYYFEENPKYLNRCREAFDVFEIGKARAITSMVTLLEVLVRPLAEKRQDLVDEYINRLTTLPNLLLSQLDEEIAVKAAAISQYYPRRLFWLKIIKAC